MRKHLVLIALFSVAGCSEDFRLPFVYRVDINQGNIFNQEMANQLKPGMTKRQAAFIMGNPLVEDPFHRDRWDYVYSNEPGGEDRVEKKLTLIFEKDELVGLEGDLRPGANAPNVTFKDVTVNIPPIQRDKTIWESITGIFSD